MSRRAWRCFEGLLSCNGVGVEGLVGGGFGVQGFRGLGVSF